jgi:hypothetical protein
MGGNLSESMGKKPREFLEEIGCELPSDHVPKDFKL